MGGTWDATNVADGQVAVIMPIGMDHSDYLGDTLADIAGEKAGIIKPTSSVVLAAQDDEAMEVLAAAASQMEAPTSVEGIHFGVLERLVAVGGQQITLRGLGADYEEVFLPLFGAHQARNAVAALAAVESFFGITSSPNRADAARGRSACTAAPSTSGMESGRRASPPTSLCPPRAGAWTPSWCARVSRRSPRRAGSRSCAGLPRWSWTPPTTCRERRRWPRPIADSFAFTSSVAVVGILADKDAAGILAALDPIIDMVVITPVELAAGPARRGAGRDRRRGPGRGARRGRRAPRCCPGACDRAGGSRVAGRGRRRCDRHRVGHDGRGGAAAPRCRVGA